MRLFSAASERGDRVDSLDGRELPPLDPGRGRLRVVVLTCGRLGFDVSVRILEVPGVSEVAVVFAPYRTRRGGFRSRLRHILRTQGPAGLVRVFLSKLTAPFGRSRTKKGGIVPEGWPATIPVLVFDDFHQAECLAALEQLDPHLGVVAGTNILKKEVFSIPRLGCVNLHSGKVPEYRGAAPAFWELYNGETSVGITIHRVTERVDEGAVLMEELFPIDPAPAGDPIEYIETFRNEVLRPNGVRMLAETVRRIAEGKVAERPQDRARGRTYRTPGRRAVKELRRRVKERRTCPGG
ncbi:MAG: formyltransferase family protein [Candidatus Eisenbacteria bacterium]